MLRPNSQSPEASGSQTGAPAQDLGDSPDRSPGHTRLPTEESWMTCQLRAPGLSWPHRWALVSGKWKGLFSLVLELGQTQCPTWTSVSQFRKCQTGRK